MEIYFSSYFFRLLWNRDRIFAPWIQKKEFWSLKMLLLYVRYDIFSYKYGTSKIMKKFGFFSCSINFSEVNCFRVRKTSLLSILLLRIFCDSLLLNLENCEGIDCILLIRNWGGKSYPIKNLLVTVHENYHLRDGVLKFWPDL